MTNHQLNLNTDYTHDNDKVYIDQIDRQILVLLQQDARMSISDIAESVHLSATPCARRIRRLEEAGIITGYHTEVSPQKLGYSLSIYIAVSMDRHTAERFAEFETKIQSFNEVVSCSIVTGRSEDYLLKVVVRNMAHYEEFLLHRLNRIEGVSQVHTSFELREVFNRGVIGT
ncbi:Lrp/AsnC family transcriptional regulator [Psychrobacter sp.]|uniref:Lrp/AsnC family transcriptional regulator n=1 Tax=Psychrobacter sp. TaxID=56811 RepID=UPI0025ECF68C|nr:Lrp/AsnC family transcriptional regulator [Psychrobacter sp.]